MQNPFYRRSTPSPRKKGVEPEIIHRRESRTPSRRRARKRYKNRDVRARFQQRTPARSSSASVSASVDEVDPIPPNQILAGRSAAAVRRRSRSRHGGRVPAPTEDLGRIAAQTAKQVIFQKVREAERENVYAEYSNRVGEVVSGVVKRFENGDIIMELGRIEAQLPAQGTVARRELRGRRPRARRDPRREPQRQGPADRALAHGSGAAHQAVRAGSAGESTTAP
jgi:N utilization substance protein A